MTSSRSPFVACTGETESTMTTSSSEYRRKTRNDACALPTRTRHCHHQRKQRRLSRRPVHPNIPLTCIPAPRSTVLPENTFTYRWASRHRSMYSATAWGKYATVTDKPISQPQHAVSFARQERRAAIPRFLSVLVSNPYGVAELLLTAEHSERTEDNVKGDIL